MDAAIDRIREVLRGDIIALNKLEDNTGIFDHVDVFVNLSRENETVQEVVLWIPSTDPDNDAPGTHRYAIRANIAEGIGNLQALRKITISDYNLMDAESEVLVPDWEILDCILRRLRRVSSYVCIMMYDYYHGIQKLYQLLLELFVDIPCHDKRI